jgi:hypothetical protein
MSNQKTGLKLIAQINKFIKKLRTRRHWTRCKDHAQCLPPLKLRKVTKELTTTASMSTLSTSKTSRSQETHLTTPITRKFLEKKSIFKRRLSQQTSFGKTASSLQEEGDAEDTSLTLLYLLHSYAQEPLFTV